MCRSVLPLLVTLSPPLLFLFQLPDIITTQEELWEDYKYGRDDLDNKNFCTWKCILFTLQWPGAFCQSLNNASLCRIPPTINNWTIHGLWPLQPRNRCDCWPMFHSDVQEVEAELTELWPSLVRFKSNFHFWREEWRKHGACAGCVEGLNSPLRYFQICLKLRGQFDIHRLLEDAGVTPSCERPYKVEEVQNVLAPHLGDKMEIQCVTDDKDRELWYQLKIRLNRNLTVGCNHASKQYPPRGTPALMRSPSTTSPLTTSSHSGPAANTANTTTTTTITSSSALSQTTTRNVFKEFKCRKMLI